MKNLGVKETTETENWIPGATDPIVYVFLHQIKDWHIVIGL